MRLSTLTWTFEAFGAVAGKVTLRADEAVWTGAIVSEIGEILTTSIPHWDAPIVELQLADGTSGEACVIGRNDDIGLALLKPLIEPPRTYDFLTLSSEESSVGQQLDLFQHTAPARESPQRSMSVIERITAATGYDYMHVDTAEPAAPDGAVLINHRGEIQGMLMPSPWLQWHEVGNLGEVYAIEAPRVASVALPLLRTGSKRIRLSHFESLAHATSSPLRSGAVQTGITLRFTSPQRQPPSTIVPLVVGEVTLDGKDAPAGSILYARLSKKDQPSYWISTALFEPGVFALPVKVPNNSYIGATIEFWMDCRRSSTTAVYNPPFGGIIELDLAF